MILIIAALALVAWWSVSLLTDASHVTRASVIAAAQVVTAVLTAATAYAALMSAIESRRAAVDARQAASRAERAMALLDPPGVAFQLVSEKRGDMAVFSLMYDMSADREMTDVNLFALVHPGTPRERSLVCPTWSIIPAGTGRGPRVELGQVPLTEVDEHHRINVTVRMDARDGKYPSMHRTANAGAAVDDSPDRLPSDWGEWNEAIWRPSTP